MLETNNWNFFTEYENWTRRVSLYTSASTLAVKYLIFRPYGSISRTIIMSDKDKRVFTMEEYVSFLGSESKMERSQK
jgi:hypothetical protein